MAEIDSTSAGNLRKARNRGFPISVLEVGSSRTFGIPGFFSFLEIKVGQNDKIPPQKKKGLLEIDTIVLSFQ